MRVDMVGIGMIADLRRAWVVFLVSDGKSFKPIHICTSRASRLFDGVPLHDKPVVMRVLETVGDRTKAIERQQAHAVLLGVPAALPMTSGAGRVRCVETGETWSTAAECAADQDIDPAALSRHLRGLTSHTAVKGRTYKRVMHDGQIRGRQNV